MLPLKLPPFTHKIKYVEEKSYIYDVFRKKNVILTPEEWVRQHVGHLLLANNYPLALIKFEAGLKYNKLLKRTDIKVYDRNGELFMLIECKASFVKIDEKTCSQAAIYGKTLHPKYIFLTNGLEHFIFEMDYENNGMKQVDNLPIFE